MKICILHNTLNVAGGAERYALSLIKVLKRNNYHVILGTFDKPDWIRIEKLWGEKPVKPDAYYWIFGRRLPFFGIYQRWLVASRLSKKLNSLADLTINTHSDHLYTDADIVCMHGVTDFNMWFRHSPWHKKLYYIPYKHLLNRGITGDPVVVANSKYTAKLIWSIYQKKSTIIHPPVDVERYRKLLNKSDDRENMVLMIGRAAWEKNLEAIPSILEHLDDKDIKFSLVTSSHIPKNKILMKLKECEQFNAGQFKIYLNLSPELKASLLKKSKVYLHTSPYETFGISIAEAMSAGLIPVMIDEGGHTDSFSGLHYHSFEEAAKAIKTAIHNWNYQRAYEYSMEMNRFSEKVFEKQFLTLLDDISDLKKLK